MKTLAVLVILVLTALYVNAEDFKRRPQPKPRPAVIDVDDDADVECTPAKQYGYYGNEPTRCRCPAQGKEMCLECNRCSCMQSRGMWRCTRMSCPWGDSSRPWALQSYTDHRGRERQRCMQTPELE